MSQSTLTWISLGISIATLLVVAVSIRLTILTGRRVRANAAYVAATRPPAPQAGPPYSGVRRADDPPSRGESS